MTGTIYLHKNGFFLYDDKTKRIFQLGFRPEIARDFEIINSDQLNLDIKSFVESNKIAPIPLIMVVSHDMFFERDFPALTKEQQAAETQRFLDNIPFEVIVSKVIISEKGFRIIAGNGHFIEEVRKAFQALGFSINIALPSIVFGNIGEELNETTIKIILGKYAPLKQYNLLKLEPIINPPPAQKKPEKEGGEKQEEVSNDNGNKRKNLIVIGIFIVFLLTLAAVVFVILNIINS